MHNHTFVFIGGAHKSGTTLITDVIATAENASAFRNTGAPMNEGQWLQSVLKQDVYFGELLFGLSPEARLDESHCRERADMGSALFDSWKPYWDLSRKYLVEKSPMNVVRTLLLQSLFPESLFIICIRDPRTSYIAAMKTIPDISPEVYFENWINIYDVYMSDSKRLKRAVFVPYERFVEMPEIELRRITDAIGVDLKNARTDRVRNDADVQYRERWARTVDPQTQKRCGGMLPTWSAEYGYE